MTRDQQSQGNYENNDAIKLIAIDIEKTYSLDGYIKFQAEAINTAKEDLLRLRSNVLELASGVCYVRWIFVFSLFAEICHSMHSSHPTSLLAVGRDISF